MRGTITPGHAVGALGLDQVELGEAVAVGGDAAQGRGLGGAGGVQIDAVEIIARLLGRDRELGAVDQPLDVLGGERERMRHVAGGQIREVILRQRLEREARAAGADRQHGAVAVGLEHDLGAVRQLAHDVVEHVRRHGGGAGSRGFRGQGFRHLEVEVGRLQRQFRVLGPDQHIAEDRNRIAALDHAVDMAQRFQELRAFDRNLHCTTRPIPKKIQR
ncbi:hypothetical protein ABIF57_006756 [Bradyrhizobium diazoefficiens]